MVNALAPGLNTISLTSVAAESERLVRLELLKVPISAGPLGIVAGVQLATVFQSPLVGLRFQVALPASASVTLRRTRVGRRNTFIAKSNRKVAVFAR
jgi:hypothetical protein